MNLCRANADWLAGKCAGNGGLLPDAKSRILGAGKVNRSACRIGWTSSAGTSERRRRGFTGKCLPVNMWCREMCRMWNVGEAWSVSSSYMANTVSCGACELVFTPHAPRNRMTIRFRKNEETASGHGCWTHRNTNGEKLLYFVDTVMHSNGRV